LFREPGHNRFPPRGDISKYAEWQDTIPSKNHTSQSPPMHIENKWEQNDIEVEIKEKSFVGRKE
jgi:hypothetical protein